MAPRQTVRRLVVAASAVALAGGMAACSPPNQKDSGAPAGSTLPSFTAVTESHTHASSSAHPSTSATSSTAASPAGSSTAPSGQVGTPAASAAAANN